MRVGDGDWRPRAQEAAEPPNVRELLRARRATIGCSVTLGSPTVAEFVASVGLDWLILESDHYGVDSADVQSLLMATSRTGTAAFVRTPPQDLGAIGKALDLGAQGVVVPMVSGVEEATEVVRATRYPPHGTRSFGPQRASRYYLDDARYLRETAQSLVVLLILETRGAVDQLDQLAAAGVDGVLMGPADLSLAYGLDPLTPQPEIDEIARRALEVGRATGLAIGVNIATPEQLAQRHAEGYTLLDVGPELQYLHAGLRGQLDAFAQLAGAGAPDAAEGGA